MLSLNSGRERGHLVSFPEISAVEMEREQESRRKRIQAPGRSIIFLKCQLRKPLIHMKKLHDAKMQGAAKLGRVRTE